MQKVSFWKKLHVIYAFFFVRKIIAHWVTFFFYCVVIPASVMFPEISLSKPIAIYIPATITILNSICTRRYNIGSPFFSIFSSYLFSFKYYCRWLFAFWSYRSLHLVVFWILFENAMSLLRTKAAIIGLLEANRVNEWVVTEKLGATAKQKNNPNRTAKKPQSRILERCVIREKGR